MFNAEVKYWSPTKQTPNINPNPIFFWNTVHFKSQIHIMRIFTFNHPPVL